MKSFFHSSLWVVSLLLVSNLFLSSCGKDNVDPQTASIPLLASIVTYSMNGQPDESQFFHYDNQGRVIKMNDNKSYSTTFEYSGTSVIEKDFNDDKLMSSTTFHLNDKGLCTSVTSQHENDSHIFEYDNDGYRQSSISESETYIYTSTFTVLDRNYVTILNEDKSKSTNSATVKEFDSLKSSVILTNPACRFASVNRLKSASSSEIENTDYQFYTDKTNTIEYENMGVSFMGKQNKNPISQETHTNSFIDGLEDTYTYTFTYEYDAKGRITKQVSDQGDYSIYTYVD